MNIILGWSAKPSPTLTYRLLMVKDNYIDFFRLRHMFKKFETYKSLVILFFIAFELYSLLTVVKCKECKAIFLLTKMSLIFRI